MDKLLIGVGVTTMAFLALKKFIYSSAPSILFEEEALYVKAGKSPLQLEEIHLSNDNWATQAKIDVVLPPDDIFILPLPDYSKTVDELDVKVMWRLRSLPLFPMSTPFRLKRGE